MRLWQMCVLGAWLGPACGNEGAEVTRADARPTVVFVNADAASVADAAEPVQDAGLSPIRVDAAAVDLWRDPSTLFPACTGTAEEISACIINLPSSSGVPVTSSEPMDYSLCRP